MTRCFVLTVLDEVGFRIDSVFCSDSVLDEVGFLLQSVLIYYLMKNMSDVPQMSDVQQMFDIITSHMW